MQLSDFRFAIYSRLQCFATGYRLAQESARSNIKYTENNELLLKHIQDEDTRLALSVIMISKPTDHQPSNAVGKPNYFVLGGLSRCSFMLRVVVS